MRSSLQSRSRAAIVGDAFAVKRRGRTAVEAAQRTRLASLVALARARSPYYRRLYRGLPAGVADPESLPATSKAELMESFDDWGCDPELTRERVGAFIADRELAGRPFLGRYMVATSSGTTGERIMLVTDEHALAVADALRLRALASWLGPGDLAGILRARGRMANLSAVGGHLTTVGLVARGALRRRRMRLFSVFAPVPELVAGLNEWRPWVLSGYASTISLLAAEQEAGRLRIAPVLVASSAEGLSPAEADRVAAAFGAPHRSTYAAAECPFMGHSCELGWIHVNSDWVLLEPVDRERRPVPPGELSDGALLTNLANRVRPLIRYELSDGLLMSPDPCPCGSPFPAVRVQGRTADLLELGPPGATVSIAAASLTMAPAAVSGIDRFQIVHCGPATLRLRLQVTAGADPERVWRDARDRLTEVLGRGGIRDVEIERAEEPPRRSQGGKLQRFVPLPRAQAGTGLSAGR